MAQYQAQMAKRHPAPRASSERGQEEAARKDAHRIYKGLMAAVPGSVRMALSEDNDLRLDLAAVIVRCVRCEHFTAPDFSAQPIIVEGSVDRACCPECYHGVLLAGSPRDKTNDDRCDLCESRGNEMFTGFTVPIGSALIMLTVGDCCAGRLMGSRGPAT